MDSLFPGAAATDNIHPLLVHFPIALFLLALASQTVAMLSRREGWQRYVNCLLYLGALMAIPTVAAGWLASDNVEKLPGYTAVIDHVETIHSTLMMTATGLGILLAAAALIRRRHVTPRLQVLLFCGLLVLGLLVAFGADRGGQLVYQYGVGGEKMSAESRGH